MGRLDGPEQVASSAITQSRAIPAGRVPRARSAEQWLVLYDGDCSLCAWLLSALLRWDRSSRVRPLALQRADADELLAELTREERMRSWHLISPSGGRTSAGGALPPLLRLLPGGSLLAGAAERLPAPTERAYRWVAEHREQLAKLVPSASKRRARDYVRACEDP